MQQNNATLRLQFDQSLLETHRLVRIESSRLVWFYLPKRSEGMTAATERVCRGTLLSRAQYLPDVRERGSRDARLDARCKITAAELGSWTAEIPAAASD